jgi:hypothetical protein
MHADGTVLSCFSQLSIQAATFAKRSECFRPVADAVRATLDYLSLHGACLLMLHQNTAFNHDSAKEWISVGCSSPKYESTATATHSPDSVSLGNDSVSSDSRRGTKEPMVISTTTTDLYQAKFISKRPRGHRAIQGLPRRLVGAHMSFERYSQ